MTDSLKITQDSFKNYFEKSLKEFLIENPNNGICKDLYGNIHYADKHKGTAYYKHIEENFVNVLMDIPAFCVLLLTHLLNEKNVTDNFFEIYRKKHKSISKYEIKKEWTILIDDEEQDIFNGYMFFLSKQLEIANEMFYGVFELAKNIVNHAKTKDKNEDKWVSAEGKIIIETKTKADLSKDKNKNLWNDYLTSLKNTNIKTSNYLKISIGDDGTRGIIDTTLDYMEKHSDFRGLPPELKENDKKEINRRLELCKNNDDEAQLLFDMYFSGGNSFLIRQAYQALQGLGLYIFTKYLSENKGFLNVQSPKHNNTNSIIDFSLYDDFTKRHAPLVDNRLFGGSEYHIILPLKNPDLKRSEQNDIKEEQKEVTLAKGVYEKMLLLERIESDFQLGHDFNIFKYEIKDRNQEKSNAFVLSIVENKAIDRTILFRAIFKIIHENNTINSIVIRNLSDRLMKSLFDLYTTFYKYNTESEPQFFYRDKLLLLLADNNKEGIKQGCIITGNSDEECLKVNQYIRHRNKGHLDIPSQMCYKTEKTNDKDNEIAIDFFLKQHTLFYEGQLIELDVFEVTDKKTGNTRFEEKTQDQLETLIDSDKIGYKWAGTHLRIGSKLHLDDFVYGKKMFQRSDKASTFAFLLAKNIFENIKPQIEKDNSNIRYTLIGYGYYSELLVSRTQGFVEKLLLEAKLTDQAKIEYIVVKDEDEIKFSRYIHNFEKRKEENTLERLLVIVPISSTLTTCLKIENAFYKTLKEKNIDNSVIVNDEKRFKVESPFYTTVVVGTNIDISDVLKIEVL
jgi:hypothetical protein